MWTSPSDLIPDSSTIINGVKVNLCLLKNHNGNNISLPTKRTNKFKGVVIHNTNRAYSADDGRQYTAATMNGAMATRTHYYVTELGAWKNLEDDDMNWSCGDGIVGEGNNGCISLEIIMNSKNRENDLKSRDNGAKLAAWILFKHNMTVDDMYTHNYFLNIRNGVKGSYSKLCTTATPTRDCPYYIVGDWEGFRKQVKGYLDILKGSTQPTEVPKSKARKIIVYRSISSAAMREGKSKLAKIVKRVQKGSYYLGENADDKWFKHVGVELYSMLKDGGALFEEVGTATIKITTTNLNIRTAPTTKSDKLTTVSKGVMLYVLNEPAKEAEGHKWIKVIINNKLGYVAGEYLTNE